MRNETDRALADLVENYEHAFNANEAGVMNDLFANDAIFVNFGGKLVRGKESLYRSQALVFGPGGPLEDVSVDYAVESVTYLAPGLAAVHVRQRTARSEADGVERSGDPLEAMFVIIAELVDGAWRIRIGQNTPVT
ncbi:SgcJ/EcaC family oxidoreductase [Actinopolyspora halophila]|uniref:SgcJ/EcaC family oxidoreductase n=1 Tax=Actinopolyspora halophila TaxID=1850 RepID=UPI0003754CA6|nr:SgcJ/EcaC family oxidoreductase [Actinopolyspora halophila]